MKSDHKKQLIRVITLSSFQFMKQNILMLNNHCKQMLNRVKCNSLDCQLVSNSAMYHNVLRIDFNLKI